MKRSHQTKSAPGFTFNPFRGANVRIFTEEGWRDYRLLIPPRNEKLAASPDGVVIVAISAARQVSCWINGVRSEAFSVLWPTVRKAPLSAY